MKTLAVCIPNYNRIEKLERLVNEVASQIKLNELGDEVQLCISDDCSTENPSDIIYELQKRFPDVDIIYKRNEQNRGMDFNFLQSAMIASSRYCWIVGNDDMPTTTGIKDALNIIKNEKNIDILLTPFDIYDEEEQIRQTIYPLRKKERKMYDTNNKNQYKELISSVIHNSGVFGFLSNVIFKRENWCKYRDRFKDKLDTIFIQMYMNIQTLEDGAVLLYAPSKIIKNYADDITNNKIDRICDIMFGLDGVVEYFFIGEEKEHLKRVLVDSYINGRVWELPDEDINKKKLKRINSPKNSIYEKFFVAPEDRKTFFEGKKVFIYGAGNYGEKTYQEIKKYGVQLVGISDSNRAKEGEKFHNYQIASLERMVEICREQEVYVLVANHFYLEDMINTLMGNEIERIAVIC